MRTKTFFSHEELYHINGISVVTKDQGTWTAIGTITTCSRGITGNFLIIASPEKKTEDERTH